MSKAQVKFRVYGLWAGDEVGHLENLTKCAAEITGWPAHVRYQCSRKRTHGLFCAQHARMAAAGKYVSVPKANRQKK